MSQFRILAVLLASVLYQLPRAADAQAVTIYRCTGKDGALTLRDSPCTAGQQQDVLNMQRPTDPPPGRDKPQRTTRPTPTAPVTQVQVIYRAPSRAMYECIDQEGRRYTSDDESGNRRWVPLWTLGYPLWQHRGGSGLQHRPRPGEGGSGVIPTHPVRPAPGYAGVVAGGGTWISDQCHPLPQEEICERLSDRRYEVIRRYNTAGPTERRQLDLEQRSLDARLSNDCGIR